MMKKLLLFLLMVTGSYIVSAQTTGDYQSKANGNWESASTWQTWNGSAWVDTTAAPGNSISYTVTILNTNIVTFGSTPSTLTIASGGTLVINNGGELDLTSGSSYAMTISSGGSVTVTGKLTSDQSTSVDGSFTIAPTGDADLTSVTKGGTGTLSIQSDATGTGELIFTGSGVTTTVQRYIYINPDSTNSYWHQIAVPVNDPPAAQVFQHHSPNVWLLEWMFTSSPQVWQHITDTTKTLSHLSGYMVSGNSSFTINWNGTITSSGFSQNIPANYAGGNGHGMIGNPFTCSYDAMSGGNLGGTNLYNQIWTWDPSNGQYATYTNGTGGTYSGIIAPGQCFFVQIQDITQTSAFTVDATKRVFSTSDIFLKKGGLLNWDDNYGKGTYAMLKVSDGKTANAVFVNFGENGTPGFENGYDGFKMFGNETSPQLYLVENDQRLSIDYIQSLSEEGERVVQMNLQPGSTGEHTIAANLDSLPDTKVILEDLVTGTMHNFNDDPYYTFNANKGDDPARFLLHFSYGPTGIETQGDVVQNTVKVYSWDKAVYISNSDNDFAEASIHIYDLYGRELVNTQAHLGNLTRIPVQVSNSYLVVKVVKGNNVVTQKVFIK